MPIGIIGSLLICTVLYVLTAAVLVGVVPYNALNDPAPIAKAVNMMGLPWFAVLVKIGAKFSRPRYAGRIASASPATGLASKHKAEQTALVNDALA